MNRCLPLPLLLPLILGCSSGPPPAATQASPEPPPIEEEAGPLQKAQTLFTSGDLSGTRQALAEFLEDEPEHPQARYLLARTLTLLGELRAARKEIEQVIEQQPENPLAWDLLANLHERLGEHRKAVAAYNQVRQRAQSRAPLRGLARCYLFLGEPDNAWEALKAARSTGVRDAQLELLSFRALSQLENLDQAETAARAFLELAMDSKGYAPYLQEVRTWLATHRTTLDPKVRQVMIDFVRAACKLRLPSSTPPEDAVLARAPARLLVADDRAVFVTLFLPGKTVRFRGRGRGKNLASALKGATEMLQEAPGYTPLSVREAAVLIELGQDLERVKLVQGPKGALTLEPGFQPGLHGIALRADGREAFCLPSDPLTRDLPDLRACLEHATTQAGLGSNAWQSATHTLHRFSTEAFLSPIPGAPPKPLSGAEPTPLPQANLIVLRRRALLAARFLSRTLRPDGSLPRAYSPPTDSYDTASGDGTGEALLARPVVAARVALALAKLQAHADRKARGKVLAAATRHVAEGLLRNRDRYSGATLAHLLRALCLLTPADGADSYAKLRAELAGELVNTTREDDIIPAAQALLELYARDKDLRWRAGALALIGNPDELSLQNPEVVEVLATVALLDAPTAPEAARRVLSWAKQRITEEVQGEPLRELAALAAVARLSAKLERRDAPRLRALVLTRAQAVLALQINDRHRFLCKEPARALGGFRATLGNSRLATEQTADSLLGLAGALELLGR